jgi:hypothetical protein
VGNRDSEVLRRFRAKLFGKISGAKKSLEKEKARPVGRACTFDFFSLYIYFSNLEWVTGTGVAEIYLHALLWDEGVRVVSTY